MGPNFDHFLYPKYLRGQVMSLKARYLYTYNFLPQIVIVHVNIIKHKKHMTPLCVCQKKIPRLSTQKTWSTTPQSVINNEPSLSNVWKQEVIREGWARNLGSATGEYLTVWGLEIKRPGIIWELEI